MKSECKVFVNGVQESRLYRDDDFEYSKTPVELGMSHLGSVVMIEVTREDKVIERFKFNANDFIYLLNSMNNTEFKVTATFRAFLKDISKKKREELEADFADQDAMIVNPRDEYQRLKEMEDEIAKDADMYIGVDYATEVIQEGENINGRNTDSISTTR